jgi:hypothetical protein
MLRKFYHRTEERINKLAFVNGRRNFYFYFFQSLFCSGSIAVIKGCYWMIELIKKGVMSLKDGKEFFIVFKWEEVFYKDENPLCYEKNDERKFEKKRMY